MNVSYVRAGASCLPFIGPIIGLYNVIEVEERLNNHAARLIADMADSFSFFAAGLAAMSGDQSGLTRSINQQAAEQERRQNRVLSLANTGRIYAICGLVGNLLSVATMVGLIALGVLKNPIIVLVVSGLLTLLSGKFIVDLSNYNKAVKAPQ